MNDKLSTQMAEAVLLEQLPEALQVKVKEDGLEAIEAFVQEEDGEECAVETIRNS